MSQATPHFRKSGFSRLAQVWVGYARVIIAPHPSWGTPTQVKNLTPFFAEFFDSAVHGLNDFFFLLLRPRTIKIRGRQLAKGLYNPGLFFFDSFHIVSLLFFRLYF
jgi:hypothetical protein